MSNDMRHLDPHELDAFVSLIKAMVAKGVPASEAWRLAIELFDSPQSRKAN